HRGIAPPVIVENSGTVTVAQDEGAALICIAQGCPSPEYRWYTYGGKDGIEPPSLIIPGPRVRQLGPVLAIEAVTPEDGGTYRCSSANAGGEASADIRLQVLTQLHLEISPPLMSVHMGGSAEFRCVVSTKQDSPHMITWYKDGRQLPSTGRGPSETLIVNNVGREDRGMYQCVVRRTEGDTAQAAAELQLGGKFVIGQYVTVHGDVISHVNISHVMVEDGGEYTCTAENRAGKTAHSARLNVYGLPYIRILPKVTAVAGEQLKLKCPVAGYPIEEIHWERSGSELPNGLRQKVLVDGTLIIEPVQKKEDSGVYTCWARNKGGQTARRSGEVNVIAPAMHVGDRASLTCSVTKGDLPLTITWKKDGRILNAGSSVSITEVDQFTSILVIESLSPEHNGNYSCVVRNAAAEVAHTQQLAVNVSLSVCLLLSVPPIIEPFSFQDGLSEGMRTRTVCGVSAGDPPLAVTWLKDGRPLSPELGVNVTSLDPYSSLLSVSSLDSRHSGDFTCVASNPAAEVRFTAKLQVKGSKSGDYEEVRDHMYTKLLGNGTLLLQHVKEDREGYYLCQADNGINSGIGKVIQLRVNSSPYFSAPSRMITVKKGDTALLHCDVNGDKPISVIWLRGGKVELNPSTNYRVNSKQDVTPDGVVAELQILNAAASDSGAYFCQASNMYGRDQQLVQLLVQEPPGPPQNIEIPSKSSTSVSLKWGHKSSDANEVFKFIIEFREADRNWGQIELTESPLLYTAVINDLKPATKYSFRILAEGPAGRSLPSDEVFITTLSEKPAGPPIKPHVRSISSSEILVMWSPPEAELRHGEIQGYNVGYRAPFMGSYNFTSVSGDGEEGGEILLSDLKKYTRYSIVVQAYNEVGSGPLSEPVTTETLEDVLLVPSSPPMDIRCTSPTSQSVQVSWQPPPNEDCNGNIQGYKLTYEPVLDESSRANDVMETRKTTALITVITGLRKFTNYSLQVLAFTKVGDGVLSTPHYCQTEEDVPGVPADIKVAVATPQSLRVSWLPPLEPNGIITKYSLYSRRSTDGRQEIDNGKQIISSHTTAFEVKNIQPHMEYQFWVSASTRIGEGQSSKVVNQLVTGRIQVPPSAPLLYVTSATSSSVLLHWKSGKTGGAAISGFTLNYRKEHGNLDEVYLSRHATSFELKGLSCGSTYHLYLTAHNKIGSSPASHPLQARTQGHPPGVPQAASFIAPNSTSVSLRLHVWPDNGCPILYFVLQYRKALESQWTLVSNALKPQRKTSITGLTSATKYVVKLEAHNMAGFSNEEFSFATLTKNGDVPPPDLITQGNDGEPFYASIKFILISVISTILGTVVLLSIPLLIRRHYKHSHREQLDNQQNAEVQRERYYATIHKVALQAGEKIPETALTDNIFWASETSEDISPYATFQLSEPSTLAQNTMLHSFMYHEHPVTEGCASPPPSSSIQRNSPYYNIQKFQSTKGHGRRRANRKDIDSDESESDQEALTSSRTESSNQLDLKQKTQAFVYHGTVQSSTSSDISPMSEQKSLPRRNRNRFLSQSGRSGSQRHILSHLSVAETAFSESPSPQGPGGVQMELSEAECDIDTLKKLKLGLRSSLWSRPQSGQQGGQQPPSDYSIAV
ncbi:hypothetical protein D910_10674, partial [Dendroctonus ponderosae]